MFLSGECWLSLLLEWALSLLSARGFALGLACVSALMSVQEAMLASAEVVAGWQWVVVVWELPARTARSVRWGAGCWWWLDSGSASGWACGRQWQFALVWACW